MSGPPPIPSRNTDPLVTALLCHVDSTSKRATVSRKAGFTCNMLSTLATGWKSVNLKTFSDLCEAAGLKIVLEPMEPK